MLEDILVGMIKDYEDPENYIYENTIEKNM